MNAQPTANRSAIDREEDLHLVREHLAILHALACADEPPSLPGCAMLRLTGPALDAAERMIRDTEIIVP